MLITVFADASYDADTNTGGWGAWVKCQRGKTEGSGAFKTDVGSALEAEMLAVANAVWLALKLAVEEDKLLIQTDCTEAIQNFEQHRGGAVCTKIVLVVEAWCQQKNVTTVFRHVKGHATTGEPRHWVNNKCDIRARREMRKARNKKARQPYSVQEGLF